MLLLLALLAVSPLTLTVDAVPHRGVPQGEQRGAQLSRTAWNELWRATESASSASGNTRGKLVAEKSSTERLKAQRASVPESLEGDQNAPSFTEKRKLGQNIPERLIDLHKATFSGIPKSESVIPGGSLARAKSLFHQRSETRHTQPKRFKGFPANTAVVKSNIDRTVLNKQLLSSPTPTEESGATAQLSAKANITVIEASGDPILAARSSTERRTKGPPMMSQRFTTQVWQPTITKKVANRPTAPRKYPPQLLTETITMSKQPKCHMPWINELSKIQFYYDGINALCKLAMTFEPCPTSGSVCRQHPVEFTCCPSTSLPVLKRCYKESSPPENVCLPTTIQMPGLPNKPRRNRRPLINIPRRHNKSRTLLKAAIQRPLVPGCSAECSPAWINMLSNIKPEVNGTLPVCTFRDVLKPCSVPDEVCSSHPVDSTCCPLKCIAELEKCYVESPPELVCTPNTLQPWFRRMRKLFTG